MNIQSHYSLKEHNSFGVEANTDWWIAFDSEEDLLSLSKDEFFASLSFVVIGEGTNLLFIDDYHGAVLSSQISSIEEGEREGAFQYVRAGSGIVWDDFVADMLQRGFYGVENLSAIPGTVGASAVQNIGAYGAEVSQFISAVETVDLHNGEKHTFTHEECAFAYRKSLFKQPEMASHVVTHVTYRLSREPQLNLSYAALKQTFEGKNPTPLEVRQAVRSIRSAKLPDHHEYPNAGSFFMNPVVEAALAETMLKAYPEMPHYPAKDGVKLSAAWLIDQSGLKGIRHGAVGTWPKQPLVIVNYEQANGREVADFAQFVVDTVKKKFAITLHPEVRYIQ